MRSLEIEFLYSELWTKEKLEGRVLTSLSACRVKTEVDVCISPFSVAVCCYDLMPTDPLRCCSSCVLSMLKESKHRALCPWFIQGVLTHNAMCCAD